MLRDFHEVPYVPILAIRPSEMNALQELPNSDKNAMLPLIALRPWVGAHKFENVLERIETAYGKRPWIADLDHNDASSDDDRPVHKKLNQLRNPVDGFSNWCKFISETELAIPCLQIRDEVDDMDEKQINSLLELDRGLILRIRKQHFGSIQKRLNLLTNVPKNYLLIILDHGQIGSGSLCDAAGGIGLVNTVTKSLNDMFIAVASTSFRFDFVDIPSQKIYERQFFNDVRANTKNAPLIYSDYGSARDERSSGGSPPPPRIDYPLQEKWVFERRAEEGRISKLEGYRSAAKALLKSSDWDANLRIWGTQMIERTALDDENAITSPARATSVRINIHLHRQLMYDKSSKAIYDTEDDWED